MPEHRKYSDIRIRVSDKEFARVTDGRELMMAGIILPLRHGTSSFDRSNCMDSGPLVYPSTSLLLEIFTHYSSFESF